MTTGGSGFLGRWSRRKAETRHKAPEPPVATAPVPAETETDAAPAEDTPAPPELPDIESLGKDSDYTVFLQDGVPDEIRNLALRKLWLSDPEFNVCDGLDDYDEDYNIIETIANKIAEAKDEAGKDEAKGGDDGAAQQKSEADETPPPQDSDERAPEAPSPQTASADDVPGEDDESDETSVPT